MIKKRCFTLFITLIMVYWQQYPGNKPRLRLESTVTPGKDEVSFHSISSVCEDQFNNIFVLDTKAFKVYKFSVDGKLLLYFGNRGQGPGDFVRPGSIHVSPDGNLIVNEERDFISIFKTDGKFLNRIRLSKGLALHFMNYKLFYCWIWNKNFKQQIMIDEKSNTLKSFFSIFYDKFSINLPDETGRLVMFNYFSEEFTPFFIFSQYKDYSVIAVSDRYEIFIMTNKGNILGKIEKNIQPGLITPKERKHLENAINKDFKFPEAARKKLIKIIPGFKNFFYNIKISNNYLWVYRVKKDISEENSPITVDLYSLKGEFKGNLMVKEIPVYISNEFIYHIETDEEDNILLKKQKYFLEFID